jgi:voltage-gated potassium channel
MLVVVIMVVGVGLFLRLIQTIFRPAKIAFPCPDCGLKRHDPDAVHCKHCGRVLNIPTEGDW